MDMLNSKVVKVVPGKKAEVLNLIPTLENLQGAVEGYIEIPYVCSKLSERKIDLIINEEGTIMALPPSLILTMEENTFPICGNVIFASVDDEGNSIGLDDEQIKYILDNIKFGQYAIRSNENGEELLINSLKVFK